MNLLRGVESYWHQSGLSEYYPYINFRLIDGSIEILQAAEIIGGARWHSGSACFVEIWIICGNENKRQTLEIFLLQTLSALLVGTTLFLDGRIY